MTDSGPDPTSAEPPQRVLAVRDDITVTTEQVVTGELTAQFHRLYLDAFEPLRIRAAARQVLTDAEFAEEMADPRVTKIIAWKGGAAVGMATVTTDLSTVPWISPEFYAACFPEAAARRAIHYFGFTLVDPAYGSAGVLSAVLEPMLRRIVGDGGVVCYDVCAFNVDTVDLPGKLSTVFGRVGRHRTEILDSQSYYIVRWADGHH
jgi:hypothetical protein